MDIILLIIITVVVIIVVVFYENRSRDEHNRPRKLIGLINNIYMCVNCNVINIETHLYVFMLFAVFLCVLCNAVLYLLNDSLPWCIIIKLNLTNFNTIKKILDNTEIEILRVSGTLKALTKIRKYKSIFIDT